MSCKYIHVMYVCVCVFTHMQYKNKGWFPKQPIITLITFLWKIQTRHE